MALFQNLITLRYLAKGDFYSEIADLHGVSRRSVCRSISSVVSAINKNLNNIKFPPSNVSLLFLIRFTDVVAKWPRSTHDATIIQTCGLKRYLEDGSHGWLLCDSGYPKRNYLITPKPNPTTQQELSFNHAHSRTRIVVDRAFGLLKSRFRCIHKSGGCLLFSPNKSAEILTVCMRLHNMCLDRGCAPPNYVLDAVEDDGYVFLGDHNAQGNAIRNQLIGQF